MMASVASAPVSVERQETFPIHYSDIQGVRYFLSNGHQVIVAPKPGPVFHINTWVRTGSLHEDAQNNGVSHFLEHLMFKGTERFGPGVFDRHMEAMGAVINAGTWKDFTHYYVTAPVGPGGDMANWHKVIDMHADMMLNAKLPDEEIGPQYDPNDEDNLPASGRERAVVIEEIGMREDQPWSRVFNALNESMYPEGHPYKRDVIGTREIIGQIPREEILCYYRTWYDAPDMISILVGPIEPEEGLKLVCLYFNFDARTAPECTTKDRHDPEVLHQELLKQYPTPGRLVETGETTTRFVMLGFHGPRPEDLEATVALDVIAQVMTEGRSSRMTQRLIEKAETPNFNTISLGQSPFKLGHVLYLSANFLSEDVDGSLNQLKAELSKLLGDEPMTADEFNLAIKKLKTNFAALAERASEIGDLIGSTLVMTDTLDSYIQYPEVLQSLTLEKVQAVAQQYLNPDKAYVAFLLPSGDAQAEPEDDTTADAA